MSVLKQEQRGLEVVKRGKYAGHVNACRTAQCAMRRFGYIKEPWTAESCGMCACLKARGK